jgi:hypothetical protein
VDYFLASGMVAPLPGAQGRAVKFARFEAVTGEIIEIVIGDVVVRVGSIWTLSGLPPSSERFGRHDP